MPAFSAKLPSYLSRDPRTQTFYLRFRYNKKLAIVMEAAEFKRSLRTKDRDSARFLASYIYRLFKGRLEAVSSMDKKWAGVYLKELYQRLLQRGQMALISEDSLSFYRHTGPDGEVRLPPMLSAKNMTECDDLIGGYPFEETFEDFKGWYDLQGDLAKTESDEEKARLTFNYIQARKQAEGQLDSSQTVAVTGLDRSLDQPMVNHEGQWVKGHYDFEHFQSFGLPKNKVAEQQKRLFTLQGLGSDVSVPEFGHIVASHFPVVIFTKLSVV
jgi:hypothetical protein